MSWRAPHPPIGKRSPCRRGDYVSPSHAEFPAKAAELTAIIEEKNQSLCEKDEVLLQKEQELQQLEKGEESTPGQQSVISEPACHKAVCNHWLSLCSYHHRSQFCPAADAPTAE